MTETAKLASATDAIAETQNVLDQMVRGVMESKLEAAKPKPRLTPVGTEIAAAGLTVLPVRADAPFPFDAPRETVERELLLIDRAMADIALATVRIREALGHVAAAPSQSPESAQKATERAADEKAAVSAVSAPGASTKGKPEPEPFDERLARQSAEAQQATFTAAPVSTWLCPVHKQAEAKTTKRGRVYMACPAGDDFERLGVE